MLYINTMDSNPDKKHISSNFYNKRTNILVYDVVMFSLRESPDKHKHTI